jgi:hemerythrin-like domain-containing protein
MAKTAKAGSKAPNAIELLKEDHASVKKAFREFEKMDHQDTATLRELVTMVCNELKVHTAIEEEIFYPAVRAEIDDEDLMNEAQVEHDAAKALIEQLEALKPDDPLFVANFAVLAEQIEHHVKEEEDEMFPQAKKHKLDLDALGEKMMARKEELMAATAG